MAWLGGPALGWTDRYELRHDGIYAHIERWLAKGKALIEAFEYRYSSCNVYCDRVNEVRDDWGYLRSYELKMTCFSGFTLTNMPALEVYAMASRGNLIMSMQQVLEELKLPATAGPDDVLGAVKKLNAEKLTAEPGLDKYVPRAEFDRLAAELHAAKASASKTAEDAAEAERKQLLDKALEDGKVVPATADFYREAMKQPGGVEQFKKFCASAPEIGGRIEATRKSPPDPKAGVAGLSPTEIKACRDTGMKPEDFAAAKEKRQQELAQMRG
jgi:phage I-like protein